MRADTTARQEIIRTEVLEAGFDAVALDPIKPELDEPILEVRRAGQRPEG